MPDLTAVIETSKGIINIKLFADQTPVTCGNFANLAKREYYNGLKFHRVIADFMIQGGCPYGNGMGGPGYEFKDECNKDLKHDKPGILSMANAGPGTNGSQFFITTVPTYHLNGRHTIFGKVVAGYNTVSAIENTAVTPRANKPLKEQKIVKAYLKASGSSNVKK